jgi:hypothetical protein
MSLLFLMPTHVASAQPLKDKDKSAGGISAPISGTFTDATGGMGRFSVRSTLTCSV